MKSIVIKNIVLTDEPLVDCELRESKLPRFEYNHPSGRHSIVDKPQYQSI